MWRNLFILEYIKNFVYMHLYLTNLQVVLVLVYDISLNSPFVLLCRRKTNLSPSISPDCLHSTGLFYREKGVEDKGNQAHCTIQRQINLGLTPESSIHLTVSRPGTDSHTGSLPYFVLWSVGVLLGLGQRLFKSY